MAGLVNSRNSRNSRNQNPSQNNNLQTFPYLNNNMNQARNTHNLQRGLGPLNANPFTNSTNIPNYNANNNHVSYANPNAANQYNRNNSPNSMNSQFNNNLNNQNHHAHNNVKVADNQGYGNAVNHQAYNNMVNQNYPVRNSTNVSNNNANSQLNMENQHTHSNSDISNQFTYNNPNITNHHAHNNHNNQNTLNQQVGNSQNNANSIPTNLSNSNYSESSQNYFTPNGANTDQAAEHNNSKNKVIFSRNTTSEVKSLDEKHAKVLQRNLEVLIQDEKNAYTFYEQIFHKCKSDYEISTISKITEISKKNFVFLNSIYKIINNSSFEVRDVEIIKDVGFSEGIKIAILVENESSLRAIEFLESISDLPLIERSNYFVFRKMLQVNLLNSLLI